MFEAYKISVAINLTNHVSKGLALMSSDFAKTAAQAKLLQTRLQGIKATAIKGSLYLGAGVGVAMLLKGPYEEAKKLAQAQADFSNLNLSALDNARVFGTATNLAHKTLGTTITDNIKLIQDLHTATGDLNKSLSLSGAYAQFSVAARVQNGGKDVDNLVSNSIKALEHRGDKVMQNPLVLQEELRRQSQAFFATKGRVSPSDYFHFSQTGKMAYTLADADFLYGPMAAMMSAKTGPTAGTAQMTTLSSLIGGHMTNKAKGFLSGLGLWEDQLSPVAKGLRADLNSDPLVQKLIAAQGDKMIVSGGLPDWAAKLAASNTNDFMLKVLAPAIRKKYGNMSDEQMGLLLTQQFNRNTADDLSFWILNQQKVEKDTSVINNSKGYASAYQSYIKSPEGAEEAASAAWKNFLAMFGSVYLPKITNGLLKLAGWLDKLGQSVEKHPAIWRALADGLMLVAAGLGLRGGGLLLSAAFKGLGLALAFQGVGGTGGAAGIKGIAAAIGSVGTAGTLLFGLAALGIVLGGMAYVLTKVAGVGHPDDDKSHPGQKWYSTGHGGYWGFDPNKSQEHAGQVWIPGSRAGGGHYAHEDGSSINTVRPAKSMMVTISQPIYLDGKVIAKNTATYLEKAGSRPASGLTTFDASQMQMHPNFNIGNN